MHTLPCDGTTFNDTCSAECPDCMRGQYKVSTWNEATKRMQCSCAECMNGKRACPFVYQQYSTGLICTGKKTFDESCANCSSSMCPTMGTTPNYTNCVQSTRAFPCVPCPHLMSASDEVKLHGMRINATTCPADGCSGRPGTFLMAPTNGEDGTFTCGLCKGCFVRQYIRGGWGFCDGTTDRDTLIEQQSVCADCNGRCQVGQYISKACTGRESYDVEIGSCSNCTSCPYGFYHTTHTRLGAPKQASHHP
jgi:hypothetical protein